MFAGCQEGETRAESGEQLLEQFAKDFVKHLAEVSANLISGRCALSIWLGLIKNFSL
jgi:hypothetical protein